MRASRRTATCIRSFDQQIVWYIDTHHDLDIRSAVLPSPDWLSVTVFDSGIVANLWLQLLFLIAKLHPVHRHTSPAATHDFLQFTGSSPRLQLLLLMRIPVPHFNSRSLTKPSSVSFSLLITFNRLISPMPHSIPLTYISAMYSEAPMLHPISLI